MIYASKPVVYEGHWSKNSYRGEGTMTWYPSYQALENQDKSQASNYEGGWDHNKFNGQGKYYWPSKNQTFTGTNN